jgi:hypothetical protein
MRYICPTRRDKYEQDKNWVDKILEDMRQSRERKAQEKREAAIDERERRREGSRPST